MTGTATHPLDKPILALETSGRILGAALYGSKGLIEEKVATEGARHGKALAPIVNELLERHSLKVKDLSAVAVSIGPGSWTGLRIGLAAAKAMAWGAGIALVTVPSLEALASTALAGKAKGDALILTLRHAYSEGLYAGLFRFTETSELPQRLITECVLNPEDLPALVDEALSNGRASGSTRVVCGDEQCLKPTGQALRERGWEVREGLDEVAAGVLAECAWQRAASEKLRRNAEEIHAAAPMYLRKSDPELKLERKKNQ